MIRGDQLQHLIEEYLLTLDDARGMEWFETPRGHARREIDDLVEWLNTRKAP